MTRKTKCSPDKWEQLRRFEVVAKVALQLKSTIGCRDYKRGAAYLYVIARDSFGLNKGETRYCLGLARNFIEDIHDATVARNKLALALNPTKFTLQAA